MIFLISENTLKSNSIINDNMDPNYLETAMSLAQNVGLQEIIGTKLLNKLTGLVEDGKIKEDGNKDYKLLLDDYITDYLMFKVTSELTLLTAYKYRNAGLVKTGDEHAKDTSMQDAQYMKTYWDNKANFFASRITSFLQANQSHYPEYCKVASCDGSISGKGQYDTTIYLG